MMTEHPLRAYRRERDLTLEEMAARANTSLATISRIEKRLQKPTHDLLIRIAEATGNAVSIEELVRASCEAA